MRYILLAACSLILWFIITRSFSLTTATIDDASEPDWHQMLLGLVKEPDISDYERTLALACRQNSEGELEQSTLSVDESVALQSALIAKILIERLRNHVDFNGDIRQAFFTQYQQKCERFLSAVPRLDFFDSQTLNEQLLLKHAEILVQFALTRIESNPRSPFQAYVYTVQWLYYNLKDDHQAAQKAAKLAILRHGKERHIIDLSEKYSYLATSLLQLGQFREALFYMRKGLATTLVDQGGQKYADAHFGLGFAYLKAGDHDSAKRYFELFYRLEFDAMTHFEFNLEDCEQYSVRAAKALVNLGKIDRINGELQLAMDKHECAIKRLEKDSDYYYYVAILERAKDLAAMGQHQQAKQLAEYLASDNRILDSHQLQALLILFAADLKQQPPLLALSTEQRILALIGIEGEEIKFPREYIEFNQLKMEYAAQIADHQRFTEHARAGFTTIRKYRQTGLLSDAWLTTQYAFVESYVSAIYANGSYSDKDKIAAILSVLDSYYALNDFDARKSQLNKTTVQNRSAELKLLMEKQRAAETSLINAQDDNRQRLRIKLDNANEALMAYAEFKPQDAHEQVNLDIELKLEQIQNALKPGEMLLRYFVAKQYSMAVVVTRESLFIHTIPERDTLRENLALLEQWSGRKQITELMRTAVFRQLLPVDTITSLGITKLIIVPDDVLHRVPFAAIDTAQSNKIYQGIGKQLQIVRTHSVKDYLLAEIAPERLLNTTEHLTIFADPAYGQNNSEYPGVLDKFERLPHTAKEAQNIKATYNHVQVNLFLAEQVTNENLLSENARHAKVLHIATHGYYEPAIADVVGIATYSETKTGFLSLTELLSQPFYSHLVVISGCETMLGKYYKGSGMKSFTRGFLSKGAGSVLGTLWKVPDHSTALFMSHFYTELKRNQGNSVEALKAARTKLSEHKDFYDPFYWSGFVLTSTNKHFEHITFK